MITFLFILLIVLFLFWIFSEKEESKTPNIGLDWWETHNVENHPDDPEPYTDDYVK
jgi:hypothetical protein